MSGFVRLGKDPKCLNGKSARDLLTGWEYTQLSMEKGLVESEAREREQEPVKCGYTAEAKNGQLDARRLLREGI